MNAQPPTAPDAKEARLPVEVVAALLALARARIACAIGALGPAPPGRLEALEAPAACFVTLSLDGRLRGCIGTTEPREALYDAIGSMAVAAATRDPRFPPLNPSDLPRARIEVSILSPLERVASPDAIQPNLHGVCVQRGYARGLFLPQVWEHFPDKEDFLGELCSGKAGLPRDAWRDAATELFTFTVDAYEEGG